MLSDTVFLTAIAADPDDPGRRLIYADWLEEQGDVRAEFIRLMEEMKTLPIHSDRFAALRPRRNELRQQLDPQWITQMGYQPTHRPMFTKLPDHRHERWRLVEEFIDIWYGPLQPGDGYSEEELQAAEKRLGFKLPAALREWYALAGKRQNQWARQDPWVEPPDLLRLMKNDSIIIRYENQGVEYWGIRLTDCSLTDPPMQRFEEPLQTSSTTTEFILQTLIYDVKCLDLIRAAESVLGSVELVEQFQAAFSKCAVSDRYWCGDPIHFYEGVDLIIESQESRDDHNPWVYVTARTEAAYAQLSDDLRSHFERYQSIIRPSS